MLRSVVQATQHGQTASQLLRVISPCSAVMCDGQSRLPQPWGSIEQRRTTVVVERIVRAPTTKPGHTVKLKNKHKLLRLVETEHTRPTPDIQCILTGYVEGYGDKGDVLWVKRRVFRNQLFPLGLAMYASPTNLAENERMRKEMDDQGKLTRLSPFARMTSRKLSGMFLPIPMSGENPWTLSRSHVKVAFRRMYVELTEDCIDLPEEEITEPGDIEVNVTINKMETVTVKARIYLVYKDPSKNVIPEMPPLWESFEKKTLAQKIAESRLS